MTSIGSIRMNRFFVLGWRRFWGCDCLLVLGVRSYGFRVTDYGLGVTGVAFWVMGHGFSYSVITSI